MQTEITKKFRPLPLRRENDWARDSMIRAYRAVTRSEFGLRGFLVTMFLKGALLLAKGD